MQIVFFYFSAFSAPANTCAAGEHQQDAGVLKLVCTNVHLLVTRRR